MEGLGSIRGLLFSNRLEIIYSKMIEYLTLYWLNMASFVFVKTMTCLN
jgi:hypothetical protein